MVTSELEPEELRRNCDLSQFDFTTTADLEPVLTALGADRALEAIDFGLQVKQRGYNVFALNLCSSEERDYITSRIKEQAQEQDIPNDLCYVYNFAKPNQPQVLSLPAGLGKEFKADIEETIDQFEAQIKQVLASEEYLQRKKQIKKQYKSQSDLLWEQLEEDVKDLGFILEREEDGFAIIPLAANGSPMSESDYNQLSVTDKEEIEMTTQSIQEKIDDTLQQIKKIKEEYQTEVENLEHKQAEQLITKYLDPLFTKYDEFRAVTNYLMALQEDILTNLDSFKQEEQESILLFNDAPQTEDELTRYQVNLVVDNSDLEGAPVVVETNPTYYNLVGRMEYDNQGNKLQTDLLNIKPGALQQANGGYLILEARKLLTNFKAWQALKQSLKNEELKIENIGQEYEKFPLVTLDPEKIPLDVKVILLGSRELYRLLYKYDPDFKQLFKIKADFAAEMDWKQENNYQLARFIAQQSQDKELYHLDYQAVERIIEYTARVNNDQTRLKTKFDVIIDLLYEADTIARLEDKEIITVTEIEQALDKRQYRQGRYEDKLHRLYKEDKIMIETSGRKIGQVNGLSVLDGGDYQVGRPIKITAVAYQGQQGVVDIEREINLSGKIHDKGVFILAAYLGNKFAQDNCLSLSASICFEQMYSAIDGDSASSAELYALLSALAEVPLRQDLAVTGAINQQGEIQPVGGVNDKIEGFFQICKEEGLTGSQGVLVPQQNVSNLMLSQEVLQATAEDEFHIYCISNVEDGIELLTGKKIGNRGPNGSFAPDTFNALVQAKINRWANNLTE
ncbi:Lon protease family protein [Halanaerobaculum tunisiense]